MKFDEYGNTGNTGLTGNKSGIIHVNTNYSATKDMVFVDNSDMEEGYPGWERITKEAAKIDKREIIKCYYCSEPAVSLDHSWPYLVSYTVCKEHDEQIKTGKLKPEE